MIEEKRELIDELGNSWITAKPEQRFVIESELRTMGCAVSVTEAGSLRVVIPNERGQVPGYVFLDEIAPVDWQKITSLFLLKTLREALAHGEIPALTYRTWGMVGRIWQPVEKKATPLKVGPKRVFIRLEDGSVKWCEPRNLSIIAVNGDKPKSS